MRPTSPLVPQRLSPPVVTKVDPNQGSTAGGMTVIITGTGFTAAKSVSFGSSQVKQGQFTIDGDTQITVTKSPASKGSRTVDVRVTTVGGTSATSQDDHFTYISPPVVTKVDPNQGPVAGGTTVTVTGTGFTGAKSVSFGSLEAPIASVNNDGTQITVTSPASKKSGRIHVTVTTVGGTSATSKSDKFTYVPPPVVTRVDPNQGPMAGDTKVIITGKRFTGTKSVFFGSSQVEQGQFTVDGDTQITVTKSPASKDSGIVDVVVTTAGGASATSEGDQFTYVPPPVVTKIEPNQGPTAGGTTVVMAPRSPQPALLAAA